MIQLTQAKHKTLQSAAVPKARGYPIIGALPNVWRIPINYLEGSREKYGDIFELNLGLTRAILLNHPRHAEHVLINHARNYVKSGPWWEASRACLGTGLATSEGDG